MQCPKCHFEHALQTTSCLRCGVVFAKYSAETQTTAPPVEAAQPDPEPVLVVEPAMSPAELERERGEAKREVMYRWFALPGALILARWLVGVTSFTHLIRSWTHEGGHAVAGWLCGMPALPSAGVTSVPDRSRIFGLLAIAALGGAVYFAWRRRRWFWVAVSAVCMVLMIVGNLQSEFPSRGFVYFFGEGGSFALATALIAAFYARPNSQMVRQQLRWALLLFGAIAFMDGYVIWFGPEHTEHLVEQLEYNDEDARGPGDVFQLTQLYGWKAGQVQDRTRGMAYLGFAAMAAMYGAGLYSATQRKKELAMESEAEGVANGAAAGD